MEPPSCIDHCRVFKGNKIRRYYLRNSKSASYWWINWAHSDRGRETNGGTSPNNWRRFQKMRRNGCLPLISFRWVPNFSSTKEIRSQDVFHSLKLHIQPRRLKVFQMNCRGSPPYSKHAALNKLPRCQKSKAWFPLAIQGVPWVLAPDIIFFSRIKDQHHISRFRDIRLLHRCIVSNGLSIHRLHRAFPDRVSQRGTRQNFNGAAPVPGGIFTIETR